MPRMPRGFEMLVDNCMSEGRLALGVVAIIGGATLAAISPVLASLIFKLYERKERRITKEEANKKARKVMYYLKRTGSIRIQMTAQERVFAITALGKRRYAQLSFDTLSIPRPKEWDGKWWVVAADIPTKTHRTAADYFRNKLYDMHFKLLQRTLWFYPYNPVAELEIITREYGIEHYVTAMEVSRLDDSDETVLRDYFKQEGIL